MKWLTTLLFFITFSAFAYSPIPSGMVITFAGSTCPVGYLPTNGASFLKTTYPLLYGSISCNHGCADSTHFNIPNYQGKFLRMVDNSAGVDPDKASRTAMATGGNTGNAVGSIQADQFKSHDHTITIAASGTNVGNGPTNVMFPQGSTSVYPSGGNETRPVNAYVNFCIKI